MFNRDNWSIWRLSAQNNNNSHLKFPSILYLFKSQFERTLYNARSQPTFACEVRIAYLVFKNKNKTALKIKGSSEVSSVEKRINNDAKKKYVQTCSVSMIPEALILWRKFSICISISDCGKLEVLLQNPCRCFTGRTFMLYCI